MSRLKLKQYPFVVIASLLSSFAASEDMRAEDIDDRAIAQAEADLAEAQEAFAVVNQQILDAHRDLAFERYVDIAQLGEATANLDPPALTDIALQLAEGERVLLRSHRAISADAVFHAAIRVAVEQQDRAALQRLAKAVEGRDEAVAAQLAAATALSAESREEDPRMIVSIEDTTPEAFLVYQDLIRRIKAAQALGNRRELEQIGHDLESVTVLEDDHLRNILSLISDAWDTIPEDTQEGEVLDLLSSASRANYGIRGFKQVDRAFGQPVKRAGRYIASQDTSNDSSRMWQNEMPRSSSQRSSSYRRPSNAGYPDRQPVYRETQHQRLQRLANDLLRQRGAAPRYPQHNRFGN